MEVTKNHNAVLIFVAPRSQTFAIIGDEAVHTKCGDAFWRELADAMSGHFKRGEFTDGIVHGINRAGDLLAEHFPRDPDDKNELPDEVIEDGREPADRPLPGAAWPVPVRSYSGFALRLSVSLIGGSSTPYVLLR